jgi:anti-anti-sigma factor
MNYNFKLENDVLTVSLEGRLDTDAATAFETELSAKCKEYPHGSLVFDASELQYIASSGLRIMLKMAKTEKNFKIENLIPAVYSVFEMTGFPKIMNITIKLQQTDTGVDKIPFSTL